MKKGYKRHRNEFDSDFKFNWIIYDLQWNNATLRIYTDATLLGIMTFLTIFFLYTLQIQVNLVDIAIEFNSMSFYSLLFLKLTKSLTCNTWLYPLFCFVKSNQNIWPPCIVTSYIIVHVYLLCSLKFPRIGFTGDYSSQTLVFLSPIYLQPDCVKFDISYLSFCRIQTLKHQRSATSGCDNTLIRN